MGEAVIRKERIYKDPFLKIHLVWFLMAEKDLKNDPMIP